MKNKRARKIFNILVICLTLTGFAGTAAASDVNSRGVSEPPFLAYGVNTNLLMLLDNSGSMLDMAYTDPNFQCFDESFATGTTYAGNFEESNETWYVWQQTIPVWTPNKWYNQYSLATFEGITYRAWTAGTSDAAVTSIEDDGNIDWIPVLRPEWRSGKWYHAYSFVFDKRGRVFYNSADGTSDAAATGPESDANIVWKRVPAYLNGDAYPADSYVLGEDLELFYTYDGGVASGEKPTDDTTVEWIPVDFHGWQTATRYDQYDIVTHDGMIYIKQDANTNASNGTTIFEDTTTWQRIDEGYFEKMAKADALSFCRNAPGAAKYSNSDVCANTNNTGAGTPDYISAFAASGNFLNWASASKFDIEKDILTGGKYSIPEQRVISENRGCAGNRFVKQVPIAQTIPAAANMFLTLSIRMPSPEDQVDWTDDTTRFEIYGITATGMDFQACQDAIEAFQDPSGLGPAESDVAACVGFDSHPAENVVHIIYHKAIQECWFYAKHGTWKGGNDHPRRTCPDLYQTMSPLDFNPWDPAYVCYGVFDETLPADKRQGFVGRCWAMGSGAGGAACDPKPRNAAECDWNVNDPCEFQPGGAGTNLYRNRSDSSFTDICYSLDGSGTGCQNKNKWRTYYTDSVTGLECDPLDPSYQGGAPQYWSDNYDGDLLVVTPPEPDAEDVADACVDQAMHDFCLQAEVPEVIDPSDEVNDTSDYWNLPAILVDTGLAGQLGGHPLSTMKVHIEQAGQPSGILHATAQQLRIGAMAFNNNGAGSECGDPSVPDQIVQYCPRSNEDGARIITPIRLGGLDTTPDDPNDDWEHVDDLVVAINAVRATSWTPLAEAMYNAIGYYTQNRDVRINRNDFQTDDDVMDGWQNNFDYTPGSMVYEAATQKLWHTVVGGRSQGADLASDTGVTWVEVGTFTGFWNAGPYDPYDIVMSADNKLYITYGGGTAVAKPASPGGPLYDDGITWEPLLDPVNEWCQENHIVIITEGASTADIHSDVAGFVQGTHVFNATAINDPGEAAADDPATQCVDGLQGSTYLDDLTYFALNPDTNADPLVIDRPYTLYPVGNDTLPSGDAPYTPVAKKNITTHIVTAGTLRDKGTADECNPLVLMESAAYNGTDTHDSSGSDLLRGENPDELKSALLELFSGLRQRASAGSAASVISSARGGEGAIYQAIFWPELKRTDENNEDIVVEWAGDVHGLFLDNKGYMFEDSPTGASHIRQLVPYEDIDGDGNFDVEEDIGEDIDVDGHFDDINEDVDGDGNLDVDEDKDDYNGDGTPEGDGKLDCGEDINCDGVLDPGEDIDGDGFLDLTEDVNGNGTFDTGAANPYSYDEDIDGDGYFDIYYEDVDGDGSLDVSEDLDGDGKLDTGEDTNYNKILDPGEDLDDDGVLDLTEDLDGDGAWDPFIDIDGDGFADNSEDLNGNGVFDIDADNDHRVLIYYDTVLGRSMACYNLSVFRTGTCTDSAEISEVNYLWSATEWLADNTLDTQTNRGSYASNEMRRYMFTWNDLNNNGIVDDSDGIPGTAPATDEIIALESSVNWATLPVSGNRGPVNKDFDLDSDAEIDMIVSWLRGNDWLTDEDINDNGVLDAGEDINGNLILDRPLRSRQIPDANGSGNDLTWRLGDIIHSTPMTVAQPAEGYHLIYNDFSYAQFLAKYKRRRHMVYFGANDGFLHAVNAGFYSEKEKKFCLVPLQTDGSCDESIAAAATAPSLGAEMWAYLPYNLQPHAPFLASPGYVHKYYVDQRPRIFDAQVFTEEAACTDMATGGKDFDAAGCLHPNGWGTILVGAMRFGGAKMNATDMNLDPNDERQFTSAYFILDITNPEAPPVLLGELTRTTDGSIIDLGFSTIITTMVIMKGVDGMADVNDWYLILGSGPHADYVTNMPNSEVLKGTSDQDAYVSVLPLNELVDGTEGMRIPAIPPQSGTSGAGSFVIDWWTNHTAFVSDEITVDFDINPSYEDYKSDAVYFGTVDGYFNTDASGKTYWEGGGHLRRLVTKKINTIPSGPFAGNPGSPFGRGHTEVVTYPWQWQVETLIDLRSQDQAVTAAPSVGTDGENFWIYFGTGRFMNVSDKTDEIQQSYYGIKEPIVEDDNGIKYMTWEMVERTNWGTTPGQKGLADVSLVQVEASSRSEDARLSCYPSNVDTTCLPWQVRPDPYLQTLEDYIAGTGSCAADGENCVDGWVKDFNFSTPNRERNVGQATLLGGLVTFTTYQPFKDVCQAEGNAYLYGVYYKTGTPWREHIFERGITGSNVKDRVDLGRGLATTPNLHVGSDDDPDDEQGPKAFVQTSTGEIREIEQENLPLSNYRTGRSKWKEYVRP